MTIGLYRDLDNVDRQFFGHDNQTGFSCRCIKE
jgi:hypothetical protein